MRRLVLDAEAFSIAAAPPSPRRREMRRMLAAARQLGTDVVVPAVVLAELYRPGRNAMVDACLSSSTAAPRCRDTDRSLARLVGGVLAAAGASSEHLADAHVVATAIEAERSVIVTGDGSDITRLAAPYTTVTVVPLPA